MAALDLVDDWHAPEAAVGVVGGAVGGRDPDGRAVRVLATRGDTGQPSRWASITKPVTALATLIAVEEGCIGLDEPAGPPGSTVRHLLAHASGLGFAQDRVLAGPGRIRIYSNIGYEVLGRAVAAGTSMPFGAYLREAVLDPLGLTGTRLEGSSAAGLVGPLDDLLRLAAELLAPTLLSAETFRGITTVAFPGLNGTLPGFGRHEPLDWGLGFELRDHKTPHWTGRHNSPATFGHFGGTGSFLWVDPAVNMACAALSRRDFDVWAVSAWPALSDAVLAEFGPLP